MVIVCARARKNGQKCRPTLLSPPSAIDSPTGQASAVRRPALIEFKVSPNSHFFFPKYYLQLNKE